MTTQEIFNTIINGLREQGCKSGRMEEKTNVYGPTGQEFVCLYRDDNGNKCAAGWIIPDDLYTPDMERVKFANSCMSKYVSLPFVNVRDVLELTEESVLLIDRLQFIHDFLDVSEWEDRFQEIARTFGLEIPRKLIQC